MWTCPKCTCLNFDEATTCHKCKTDIPSSVAEAVAVRVAQQIKANAKPKGLICAAVLLVSCAVEPNILQMLDLFKTIVPDWETQSDRATKTVNKWTKQPITESGLRALAAMELKIGGHEADCYIDRIYKLKLNRGEASCLVIYDESVIPPTKVETKKSFIQSTFLEMLGVEISGMLGVEIVTLVTIGILSLTGFIWSLVGEASHPLVVTSGAFAGVFALPWLLFCCGRVGAKIMENVRLGYLNMHVFPYWGGGVGRTLFSQPINVEGMPRWYRFWLVYRWVGLNGLFAGVTYGIVFYILWFIKNSPRFKD